MTMDTGTNGFDMATFLNTALSRANDGEFGNNSFLWIILLFLLFGGRGFGFGNGLNNAATELAGTEAIEAAINKARANELSDQVVLEAVNGNRTAISEIANTLGVNQSAIMTALNQLNTGLLNVGNQIGLTSQQVINAIQLGNQNLGQQLMSCCCDMKSNMIAGFGDIKSTMIDKSNAAIIQNMQQTTELKGTMEAGFALMGNRFNDQTAAMTAGFQSIKDLFNQSKIDSLQEKVTQLQNAQSNAAQTAAITGYVQAAVTPLQNAVNVLYERSTPAPVPAYVVANPNGVVPTCGCIGG